MLNHLYAKLKSYKLIIIAKSKTQKVLLDMKQISCGRKKGKETWNFLLFSLEILNENKYFFAKDIGKKSFY